MSDYPYAERFPVNRTMPSTGRDRAEVLDELRQISFSADQSALEIGAMVTSTQLAASSEVEVARRVTWRSRLGLAMFIGGTLYVLFALQRYLT